MASAQAGGQWRWLYQARQCLSLDSGHGQGTALRRSIRKSQLAQDPWQVCQAGHSANARHAPGPSALLGDHSKRIVDGYWLKMYDKAGLVLRVETVINNPEEFKVRKKVTRNGKSKIEWVAMRKGVAYLFRYQQVSFQANSRYLEALAVVDDPTNAKRDLDRMTTRKKDTAGRGCSGFNPMARRDAELFRSIMDGDHCLRGFSNRATRRRVFCSCRQLHPLLQKVVNCRPHSSCRTLTRLVAGSGRKYCRGTDVRRGEYLFERKETVLDSQRSPSPSYRPPLGIPILSPLAPFRTSDMPSRFPRLQLAE